MNVGDKNPDAIKSVKSLNYKIIVIDDDEGLNRLIQKNLHKEGYKTDGFLSGKEALKKFSGDENIVLLIDYKLPDMTGKELMKKIIEKYNYTPPSIIITGYGDEKVVVEMMKMGIWDYIVKEHDFIDILPNKIKHLIDDIEKTKKLKKTEDDLLKTLEILNTTGEMARVGGWEVDLQENTVFWTQSTKKIHEVAEDFVPKLEDAINFFPGESKTQLEKAIDKAIKLGIGYDLELQFVTAKGNKLWVQSIGKPKMKDGKCISLRGVFQDITERKISEELLKTNQAILKRTQKIAKVGSWDWDVATDTVSWSDELFRIFKLNPENGAVSYADHPKIYTPKSMQLLDEAVGRALKTGEPYEIDVEIIRGDGTMAFCTSRGFAKKDAKGKITQLFGSFQDITERKKAEEQLKALNQQLQANEQQLKASNQQLQASEQQLKASNQQLQASEQQLRAANQQLQASEQQLRAANQQLQASEQQLRAANQQLRINEKELKNSKEKAESYLNIAAEIILSLDTDGNITMLNDSGYQLLGYEVGTLIGKEWFSQCIPEEKVNSISNVFSQLMKDNVENVTNYESNIVTKSGEVKTILWYNTVLKDENGKITGTLSSGEDITERVKIEKDLLLAKEKAEESGRLKSAFLANMSHEIRTPMNGILGFTNLLKEPDSTGEKQQKYIDIIQKSGIRMLNTVNDIIDISKIESGQVELSVSEVNLNEQLNELYLFFKPEAAKKGIELISKNDLSEQNIIINTDLEKFNSMVTNLIKNAIKFTNKGTIELGYIINKENGLSELKFYIKDTGIGIPKHRQEAIFDRFVQSDIEDKQAKQGSGLGLAISKAYAELLGGKMWVESDLGKGSTFYFNIIFNSKNKSKSITNNIEQVLKEDNTNGKLKILVVEDDKISQELISIIVENLAKKLILTNSGREAVEICQNNPDIDLILMDIQLPGINGYEACQQIREFNKDVAIIAQTAYALAGDKEKAIEMGCNDYISKPVNQSELIKLIETYSGK